MTFQPDIIVTGPDGVALVVEAEMSIPDLGRTEEQLGSYMISMQCPTGLLITPERMWVYRDRFSSPPRVERVGEFDMHGVWPQQPPANALSFELFVQQWIERVAQQPTNDQSRNFTQAVREYVLPAVASGDVRTAHPRYS